MVTYKLSPSSLNLMEECPRCFWLDKHGVWKRPASIFPSLPSGMDGILKTHFDKFRDKGILPPELCNNGECKNLKLFNEPELLKVWRSNFKGIRYEDENGNILFGAVDNILAKGKKLIVLDYKTRGFPLKEDTADHYQNQLDIYNFLLRKNGYETEDYSFLLFYVPKEVMETGEVIFDTELIKRKIDIKNAEKIFNKAIKLLNSECPKESCEWCKGV
ncbi:MAG: PD-(D/E)XK nuclease family protein [Candidatus Nanoarchaeia archaeon]|nr:PD-(D/E)XK nuclease family protein [Candidatus Nanoarchaeia archaeon]